MQSGHKKRRYPSRVLEGISRTWIICVIRSSFLSLRKTSLVKYYPMLHLRIEERDGAENSTGHRSNTIESSLCNHLQLDRNHQAFLLFLRLWRPSLQTEDPGQKSDHNNLKHHVLWPRWCPFLQSAWKWPPWSAKGGFESAVFSCSVWCIPDGLPGRSSSIRDFFDTIFPGHLFD